MVQVAGNGNQTMVSDALLHSEGELLFAFSKQQLRYRQPFTAGEVILDDGDNDISKYKESLGFHRRRSYNSSDDSNGTHGSNSFLPGLIKKIGFGSQELKEKEIHASEIAHPSGMPRSSSHGFLTGLIKKVGFASQEFKHLGDQEHHHHHHYHHSHGTRDKEIFGSEDADENYRENQGLFGIRDMKNQQSVERANSIFGFEDTEFERGKKGLDLFGSDDPNTLSFRKKMNIVGPVDADADEIERTRQVFGDENAEDSDVEVISVDDLKHEKNVHNGYSRRN